MVTNFPNGITSFGVPLLGSGGIPTTTGNYYFVDSGSGSAGNPGTKSKPMATIDQAVGKCTAAQGDVIVVMPGHAENIASATSLVVDVAGISIIGLGTGRNRPVLTFTATAGSIELDAANCRVSNLVLLSSITAVVVGINVDAADVTLENLEFNFEDTGDDFITMIDTDGVSRFTVQNCVFIAEETAGTDEAIRLDTATNARILDCYFTGDYTNSAILGEGALSTGIEISRNHIYNSDVTAGLCIDLNVASTGIIAENKMGSALVGAESSAFDPGSCRCINNYLSNATDGNAVQVPTTGIAVWRVVKKADDVFDGATTNAHGEFDGTDSAHTLFTVTGDVEVRVVGIVNTTLTGASGTVEVGVVGNTAQFIALDTATEMLDGDVFTDAGDEVGADVWPEESHIINDGLDIIETTATADVTAGQIDYYCLWRALEDGASVVAA